MLTALAKKPEERFGSVQAFARALEQASQIAPSPPVLSPPGEPQPPQRGISRRTVVLGLAALAAAGAGIAWFAGLLSSHSASNTSTSTPPVETTLFTYTGHSAAVRAVGWSPDGKRIASGSGDTTVQVWSLG